MKIAIIALVFLVITGCQTALVLVANDGSSAEKAVTLEAKDIANSENSELGWLRRHFPGFRLAQVEKVDGEEIAFGHRSEVVNGRLLSVYTIVLKDETIRTVYFETKPIKRPSR